MLCSVCSRNVTTTGAVATCTTCNADGTAAGLKNYPADTPLDSAMNEGLLNRFSAIAEPTPVVVKAKKKKRAVMKKAEPVLKRKLPPPIKKKPTTKKAKK